MSETKWTRGPWSVEASGIEAGQKGAFVPFGGCGCCGSPWMTAQVEFQDSGRAKADANLIAAAPALYEALADLLDATTCFNGELINDDERRAARIALAAARGES